MSTHHVLEGVEDIAIKSSQESAYLFLVSSNKAKENPTQLQ